MRDAMLRPKLLLLRRAIVRSRPVDPGVPFFPLYSSGIGDAGGSAEAGVQSTGGIRVGRMSAFGWGLAAAIGAVAGRMAAPLVSLTPDLMSGILEINDRTQ